MNRKKLSAFSVFVMLYMVTTVSCSKSDSYNVRVKFKNVTGHELKGLIIGDQRLGNLKNDEQTGYIQFEEFHFDSGTPIESVKAKIDHEKINNFSGFSECGTMRYSVNEGSFEVEIRKKDNSNKVFLQLEVE
jgi:hypothetical protein